MMDKYAKEQIKCIVTHVAHGSRYDTGLVLISTLDSFEYDCRMDSRAAHTKVKVLPLAVWPYAKTTAL
jgi:hypothetical protein